MRDATHTPHFVNIGKILHHYRMPSLALFRGVADPTVAWDIVLGEDKMREREASNDFTFGDDGGFCA
jgi:hypothetical protein